MSVKIALLSFVAALTLIQLPNVYALENEQALSNSLIAYVDGSGQIWVIEEGGGSAKQITQDGLNSQPVWSPDGSEIYFIRERDGEVFFGTYNLEQEQEIFFHQQGINPDSSIDISPDGQSLVFVHRDCLSVLDIPDDKVRDLKCMGLQDEQVPAGYLDPAFSPSGAEVIFTQWGFESATIFQIPFEGGNPQMFGCCYDPVFFPDGKSLAVVISPYFATGLTGSTNSTGGIYRLDLDSAQYDPILTDETYSYSFSDMDISSDGQRILYQRTDRSNKTGQIEILNLENGDVQFVTEGYQPSWYLGETSTQVNETNRLEANGGNSIAFILDGEIWLMDTASDNKSQLTTGTSYEFLSWSPDGSLLAASGERMEMDLIDPESGSIETIGQTCYRPNIEPVWSPNSKYILFTDCSEEDVKNRIIDLTGNQSIEMDKTFNISVWSQDSTSIYYFDYSGSGPGFWEYELFTQSSTFLPVTGTNIKDRLNPGEVYPSENTTWFAIWQYWSEGTGEVILLNPNGEGRIIFTPETDSHGGDPLGDWSPDGMQFVFQSGNTFWASAAPIYIYHLDSDSMRTLWDAGGLNPRWSPDGSVVAFSTWKGGLIIIDPMTGETQELIPDSPDSMLEKYTSFVGEHIGYFATGNWEPSWSPTGDQLIFTQRDGYSIIDYQSGSQQWIDRGSSPKWRPTILTPEPTETATQPPPTQSLPTQTVFPAETATPAPANTDTPLPAMVIGQQLDGADSQNDLVGYGLVLIGVLFFTGGIVLYVIYRRKIKKSGQVLSTPANPVSQTTSQVAAAQLIGVKGELKGQVFPIFDSFLIGRGAACNLQLADPSVSRLHAKLRFAANNWYLQDQESQIGSFVNGERIDSMIIARGDRIQIGESVFEFRTGS